MDGVKPSAGRRLWGWGKELLLILVSALLLSLILKTFFFQSFWIPSGSMEPTLQLNDRILVTKWRPGVLDLRRGDIAVFKDPGTWLPAVDNSSDTPLQTAGKAVLTFTGLLPEDAGEHLVKRIVGLPGETIECCDSEGRLLIDGEPLDEQYLPAGVDPSAFEFHATVPDNYVYMLGDNRSNSADSRVHQGDPGGGAISINSIVGTAFVTVWPFEHMHTLGNPYENPDVIED